MKKQTKQSAGKKSRFLPVLTAIVVLAAVAVILFSGLSDGDSGEPPKGTTLPAGSDLVIQTEEIGTEASYFDYDANGTTVQVLAVQATDDTVRLALNTCQICNGSPYAYFEQEGDYFICQNCKNRFSSTDIGKVSGGCNPIPITAEFYTEQDGTITILADFLESNAARFTNWKKF